MSLFQAGIRHGKSHSDIVLFVAITGICRLVIPVGLLPISVDTKPPREPLLLASYLNASLQCCGFFVVMLFVCLLRGVQEIANSYVDQQQQSKKRRDVIAREGRRLEKRKAEKARTESAWHPALLSSWTRKLS